MGNASSHKPDDTKPEKLDIIAVGAHPDDIEIACGGTLARLVEQGHRVGIIDLTDGEPTPLSAGPEVRLAEAKAAAEVLGVHQRITLELPNRRLFDSFEARVMLANEFRRYRPRLVIGLQGRTPMASPDHWQAMQITDAAVFYSKLTKWDDEFDGLPPHTIRSQLYCSLVALFQGATSQDTATLPGTIVVDISQTLEKKLASVRCYETQFPKEKQYIFTRLESGARSLGQTSGVEAGELLFAPRIPATQDLMAYVRGR